MVVGEVARTDHRGGGWQRDVESQSPFAALARDHHRVEFEDQTFLFISASVLSDNLPKSPLFCASPVELRYVPSCARIDKTGGWQLIWWTIHLLRLDNTPAQTAYL